MLLLKPKWGPQPRQVGPESKEVPGWDGGEDQAMVLAWTRVLPRWE